MWLKIETLYRSVVMVESEKIFLRARIPRELHRELKRASVDDDCTIEQMVAIAVTEWLDRRRENKPTVNDDKEDLARFVRKLAQGTRPTDEDCIFAAHESGIDTELALKLRDQIFTKPKNGINH